MAVGTTAFPTALDTAVELVEVTNNASTTLTNSITNSDTTITIDDPSEFPTTGFGTLVDDLTTPTTIEIISWTGKSGSDLTGVTRGAQGTSAAAFSAGEFIEVRPTKGHHEALRGAMIATETKLGYGSSTPSANTVLLGNGTGTSAWGAITNDYIDASAAIAHSKMAALTASRLMVTDASGFASASSVTDTEAGYLSGVTSAIQTQLDGKQAAFSDQNANIVYAGPATGAAAAPTFRALVAADIPDISATYLTVATAGSTYLTISNAASTYQPLDSDLTAIAALSPTDDDIIQRKAGAWTNRTMAQLKADLSLSASDVGLGNVENTALSTWAGSSNITTLGTVTTGTLSTGAVIGGVTMTLGSDGTGDIYYRSAGGVLTRLAAGTDGHVLTLASGLPSWAAASGGGGLTVGTTAIASGTAGRILYETGGNVLGEIAGSSVTAGGSTIFGLDTSGATTSFYLGGQTDTGNNGFRFFGLSPHLYTDLRVGTGGFWYIRMDNSFGSTIRLTLDNVGQFGVNISASLGAQLHAVSGSASRVGLRVDSAATPTAPVLRLTNNGTTGYEFWGSYWQIQKEASTDPTTSELTAGDHFAVYRKNDKLAIAYNNGGTMNYLTIPLDGSTTTWTNSTTAP